MTTIKIIYIVSFAPDGIPDSDDGRWAGPIAAYDDESVAEAAAQRHRDEGTWGDFSHTKIDHPDYDPDNTSSDRSFWIEVESVDLYSVDTRSEDEREFDEDQIAHEERRKRFNPLLLKWLNDRDLTMNSWPDDVGESNLLAADEEFGEGRKLDEDGWPMAVDIERPRINIGDVVRDNHGREGIVVKDERTPDAEWLARQSDARVRRQAPEERWLTVLPFDGGSALCPESLATHLRPMTLDDFSSAHKGGNGFAKDELEELFPAHARTHADRELSR